VQSDGNDLDDRDDECGQDADDHEHRCIVGDKGGATLIAVGEGWLVGSAGIVCSEFSTDFIDTNGAIGIEIGTSNS